MKFKLIYPKWPKIGRQSEFHLPPHGPVVFAASLPDDVDVSFTDENLQTVDFDDDVDVVGISMMLTTSRPPSQVRNFLARATAPS